ncbi:MAG: hypothetical protein V1770_03455, partial [bacterium]
NINFSDYQELEQNPKMRENLKLLDKLEKENPKFEKAFEAMVEKNVAEKAGGKKDLLKEYAKEEIAMILSENGTKIGHKKELRYDILARIIPVYEELKKHIDEIPELKTVENKEQALVGLSLYLGYQHNFPFSYGLSLDILELNQRLDSNQKLLRVSKGNKEFFKKEKSDLIVSAQELKKELKQTAKKFKEEKEKIDDIEQTFKSLGLSKNPKQNALRWRNAGNLMAKQEWFNQLDLPEFYYPKQVTGLSFEMRKKGEEKMNFREFYSTHKGSSEEELPIEANQLIASTEPMAAAKLLVLSKEKQEHYFEKVLKPLLINFYIATSESKEDAAMKFTDDIKGVRDIPELVNLIQRKIVLPIERELK